ISILAEPHVAVVDVNARRHGTLDASRAYLEYTYTEEAQEVFAKHYYRPTNEAILAKHLGEGKQFRELRRFPITDIAKDWLDAQSKYTGNGSIFDTIYKPGR